MCSSSLPLIWLSVYKRTGRVHLACARYKCSHSPLINQLHLSIKTLFFPISVFQFESVFYCKSRICCGSDITTWMPRKLNPFRLRIYGGCVCVVRQTVYCVYSEWVDGWVMVKLSSGHFTLNHSLPTGIYLQRESEESLMYTRRWWWWWCVKVDDSSQYTYTNTYGIS